MTKQLFISPVRNRKIMTVPLFNKDKIGTKIRNWMAVIEPSRDNRPYHLERDFIPKVHQNFDEGYYIVTSRLDVGCAVEFGSTIEMSKDAQPLKQKWYGVITTMNDSQISFMPTDTAQEAFDYASEMKWNEAMTEQEMAIELVEDIKKQIEKAVLKRNQLTLDIEELCRERDKLTNKILDRQPEDYDTTSPFEELLGLDMENVSANVSMELTEEPVHETKAEESIDIFNLFGTFNK